MCAHSCPLVLFRGTQPDLLAPTSFPRPPGTCALHQHTVNDTCIHSHWFVVHKFELHLHRHATVICTPEILTIQLIIMSSIKIYTIYRVQTTVPVDGPESKEPGGPLESLILRRRTLFTVPNISLCRYHSPHHSTYNNGISFMKKIKLKSK